METFKFYIPLTKSTDEEITGIASTTSVDRDDERMSTDALRSMAADINRLGVNLFGNHEHSWENTLGVVTAGTVSGDQLSVRFRLDDPSTNPKIPMLLNKLARGIRLGLSVGGHVTKTRKEYSKELGKNVKVIDDVRLYEISVVGIPSNPDCNIMATAVLAKSASPMVKWRSLCDRCGTQFETADPQFITLCPKCRKETGRDSLEEKSYNDDAGKPITVCQQCGKKTDPEDLRIRSYGNGERGPICADCGMTKCGVQKSTITRTVHDARDGAHRVDLFTSGDEWGSDENYVVMCGNEFVAETSSLAQAKSKLEVHKKKCGRSEKSSAYADCGMTKTEKSVRVGSRVRIRSTTMPGTVQEVDLNTHSVIVLLQNGEPVRAMMSDVQDMSDYDEKAWELPCEACGKRFNARSMWETYCPKCRKERGEGAVSMRESPDYRPRAKKEVQNLNISKSPHQLQCPLCGAGVRAIKHAPGVPHLGQCAKCGTMVAQDHMVNRPSAFAGGLAQ